MNRASLAKFHNLYKLAFLPNQCLDFLIDYDGTFHIHYSAPKIVRAVFDIAVAHPKEEAKLLNGPFNFFVNKPFSLCILENEQFKCKNGTIVYLVRKKGRSKTPVIILEI